MGTLTESDRPLRERLPLRGRIVGVYASGGAPWHHLAHAARYGAEVRPVRAEDVASGRLEELDAFVVPGGGALAMAGLLAPLGAEGAERVRRWVEGGGTYVSSCAGSVLPIALAEEADALLPTARCLRMVDVPLANPGDATLGGLASPGVGRIEVRLDSAHPLAARLPERFELVHYNGPLFDLARAGEGVRAFAWPTAVTSAFTPAERFLPAPREATPVPDGETTIARCLAAGAATGVEAPVGSGRAILFGSHPEFGLGPLLLGWGAGADLLAAALAQSAPAGRAQRSGEPWSTQPEHLGRSLAELVDAVAAVLRRAAAAFYDLVRHEVSFAGRVGTWLDEGYGAAFHGRPAQLAWRDDTVAAARVARVAASDLVALRAYLDDDDRRWLDDAPRADQDFGAMGLMQLGERITALLERAERELSTPPERPAHAYDLFDRHPYHLAVGSYLSAAGLTSAALLLVAVIAARHGAPLPEGESLLWLDREGS
jgi:hypothetical protein